MQAGRLDERLGCVWRSRRVCPTGVDVVCWQRGDSEHARLSCRERRTWRKGSSQIQRTQSVSVGERQSIDLYTRTSGFSCFATQEEQKVDLEILSPQIRATGKLQLNRTRPWRRRTGPTFLTHLLLSNQNKKRPKTETEQSFLSK